MSSTRKGKALGIISGCFLALAAASFATNYFELGPNRFQELWKIFLVLGILALFGWLVFRLLHAGLRRAGQTRAAGAMVHLQSVAAAVVLALAAGGLFGGLQAAVVSLGLVGFGLTLALQRPILAIAGWATLVFGGSVREGDRIQLGDSGGDVLAINLFTTRIWEIGASNSRTPGRPTGRTRTVSNAAFLEQAVANSTTDTATVFDEFVVNVAFESDHLIAMKILKEVSDEVLNSDTHAKAAREYKRLTRGLAIEADFPEAPIILAESQASWMDYRLRYLVDARRAGRVRSQLAQVWLEKSATHPELLPIYNRAQTMSIGPDGRPK